MNEASREGIIDLTGRLREEVTQILKRKTLITEGILVIIPEISLNPISRKQILKEIHSRIQA